MQRTDSALGLALRPICLAPRLVLAARVVVQRIVALQRPALHQLLARELLPIVMLLRFFDDLRAIATGSTTAPSSSATMMSPGITVTPPQAIGTLTALG